MSCAVTPQLADATRRAVAVEQRCSQLAAGAAWWMAGHGLWRWPGSGKAAGGSAARVRRYVGCVLSAVMLESQQGGRGGASRPCATPLGVGRSTKEPEISEHLWPRSGHAAERCQTGGGALAVRLLRARPQTEPLWRVCGVGTVWATPGSSDLRQTSTPKYISSFSHKPHLK